MEKNVHAMLTCKADRHNELFGKELESKMTIVGEHSIQDIATVIFKRLQESIGEFTVAPSLSEVRLSKTIARHYGYISRPGKIKKVFTVTQRDRDGLLQIKRKGPKAIYFKNILCKPEKIEPLRWPQWTKEAEQAVISQEASCLDGEFNPERIFQVMGDVVRKKLKIRAINKNNNRVYTIGVDETTAPNGKAIRQIEIEYIGVENFDVENFDVENIGIENLCIEKKGVEPNTVYSNQLYTDTLDSVIELEIATEIKNIETMVFDMCSQNHISLKPTQKTKFKWLRKMHDLSGCMTTF